MKATLVVPPDLLPAISALAQEHEMPLQVASEGEATVQVVKAAAGVESDITALQAGGWIKCPTALAMAEELRISSLAMGKLIFALDIKIRACGLGCF